MGYGSGKVWPEVDTIMILRNRKTGETMDAAPVGQAGLGAYLAGDWDIASGSLGELTNDPSVLSGGTSGLIDSFRMSEPGGRNNLKYASTSTSLGDNSNPANQGSGSMGTIRVKLANGQIRSFPYGSAADGPPLDAALRAGGKVLDTDDAPMQMTGGVYQGWVATGSDGHPLPLSVIATGRWLPYQKEMIRNYVNAGWRPGQPALTSEPALPQGAKEYYRNYQGQTDPYSSRTSYGGGGASSTGTTGLPRPLGLNELNRYVVPGFSLKPTNLTLKGPDGETFSSYDMNAIQDKLDQGWQVMEGDTPITGKMAGGDPESEVWTPAGGGELTLRNENGETQVIDAGDRDAINTALDSGWTPLNPQGNPYTITGEGASRLFTDPDKADTAPMRLSVILGGSYTPGTQRDRVRKFQGGWLIDDRPVNTVVSGLIDPSQRQALIDAGVWHPEWDDPNDPNFISQVGLNDPRHSWTTPGKMWNPATGAFDDYDVGTGAGGTGAGGTVSLGDFDPTGTLLEPWLDQFTPPEQYKAKTFDEQFDPSEQYKARTFDKPFEFNYDDLANDPGFQFRMDRALKAIERPAASGGRLLSGRTFSELSDRASGMASDEFSAAHGRKFGEYLTEAGLFDKNEQTKVANSDTEYGRKFGEYLTKAGLFDKNEQTKTGNSDTAYRRALGEFGLDYDIFKNNQTDIFNKLNVMSGGGSVASGSLGSLMSQYGRDASSLYNDAAGAAAGGVAGRTNSNQSIFNMLRDIAFYKSFGLL